MLDGSRVIIEALDMGLFGTRFLKILPSFPVNLAVI